MDITVHLDAGYDSQKTRDELHARGMTGEIAHKGDKAPVQAGPALARRADQRLAQRLQPPPALLRAQRGTSSTRSSTSPTRSSPSAA